MNKVKDENGKDIDLLAERNEKILGYLNPTLLRQAQEKDNNEVLPKPLNKNYGVPIAAKLNEVLRKSDIELPVKIFEYDPDDLKECFLAFMELISKINEYIEYIPTKPLFAAYLGISTPKYNKLLETSTDERIKDLILKIEDYLTDMAFVAAENGNVNDKSTWNRLRTKEYGQNLVQTESTGTLSDSGQKKAPEIIYVQVKSLIGDMVKKLK